MAPMRHRRSASFTTWYPRHRRAAKTAGSAWARTSGKVQNSVRDVAVANGILFVCNEPDSLVNLYSLADGTFLGSSNPLDDKPTHLEIQNGGLYVSAGPLLYWGQFPTTVSGALSSPLLSLTPVTITPPRRRQQNRRNLVQQRRHPVPCTCRFKRAPAAHLGAHFQLRGDAEFARRPCRHLSTARNSWPAVPIRLRHPRVRPLHFRL